MKSKPHVKVIGFDADDTLWLNEVHYRNTEQFLMIGNSLKSDVIPVLDIGSNAIHIPYHMTWEHEHVSRRTRIQPDLTIENFHDLLEVFLPVGCADKGLAGNRNN